MLNISKDVNKINKNIIFIQKYIRMFLIRNKLYNKIQHKNFIISSKYQTKNWRKKCKWYSTGKLNECEKFQIKIIEKIIKTKLKKTNDRIYRESYEILSNKNPYIMQNGLEYSENFDRKLYVNNNTYYFNFKFICDKGGHQTRSIKDVYYFIEYQFEYLIKYNINNIYFINILEGDFNFANKDKFKYLIEKNKYLDVKKYLFIGDLYEFEKIKLNIIKI
jgi:hypothetical protein